MSNDDRITNTCAQSAVAISTLISELETIRTNLSVAAGGEMKPLEKDDSLNDSFSQLLFDLERLQERAYRLESRYTLSTIGDALHKTLRDGRSRYRLILEKEELSNVK